CVGPCVVQESSSGIHVQNVQVCYIGKHVPWWFAAPINPSHPIYTTFTSI
uniref:Uncharacterized protein n=1 Tax=Macaca fascicularis TaxID=9541 RepID=A0A7N9CRH1_MACFA